MRRTHLFLAIAATLLAMPVSAQVIDLFDNQDKMDSKPVNIGNTDGTPIVESGSHSDEFGGGVQVDGGITLKFERKDNSIMVPATIRGKTVYFLFDTGATYTTLTGAFAKAVGIFPKKGYPVGMSQTANGPRSMPFGLIDRLVLGGRPHSGVTYSVCDECPTGIYKGRPVVGLLGLNVVGRYRYSIDEGAGKIEMYPHSNYTERIRDIRPWLEMVDNAAIPVDLSVVKYQFVVKNVAPKSIRSIEGSLECGNGKSHKVKREGVGSKKTVKFSKSFGKGECPAPRFDISSAKW